ncbi:NAD(+) synthase (plasmid) [Haladaptatus sp. SPP-AMP-3]|uniref:NAD(+) synthase n=1 Tax=Haladaptatus sp. SPP-AMP-3 TaxID=3121295 RepID=UPI003C2EF48F
MATTPTVRTADEPLDVRFTDAELDAERERILSVIEEHVAGEVERMDVSRELDTAVVGLSGGVDSTLVAYLAVEALGTENVYGIVMPSEASGDETMSDAERVASDLGIDYDVVEIQPIVDTITDALPDHGERDDPVGRFQRDLTALRTRTLLEYLNVMEMNGVVVGTSNRSEWLTGHFDKYGDAAVDCQPILHLYKGQVRQLSRYVGVPDRIVERKASPEIGAAGTDEENLGADYETIDSVLALTVDGPVSPGRTAELLGVAAETVERIVSLYEQSDMERTFLPSLDLRAGT